MRLHHEGVAACLPFAALLVACAPARVQPPAHTRSERASYQWRGQAREYLVHRPAAGVRPDALVVVLHGCAQDAADVARGTRFSEWAERERFTVLYPEQPARANAQRCWNWFSPEAMSPERGELGLVAALTDSIARVAGVPPDRVALVGLSAGAALAAELAIAYPARFGAMALHSGVPARAATTLPGALALMQRGPWSTDSLGILTSAARGAGARAIPVLLLHGAADRIVASANLHAMAVQWTMSNAAAEGYPPGAARPITPTRAPPSPGHAMHGMRVDDSRGRASVEWWRIEGLGHAWSGGDPSGSYTMPSGPDATAMIINFLREAWAR